MKGASEFVLGYGSLAAEGDGGAVAVLRGWRRTWGVAMDNRLDVPGYKSYRLRSDASRPAVFVAFLDIEPAADASVTGACLPVDARRLGALDRRERNYERVDVSAQVVDAPGRVWAYVGSAGGRDRLREGRRQGCAVVSRDYLDGALAAIDAAAPAEAAAIRRAVTHDGLAVLWLDRVQIP